MREEDEDPRMNKATRLAIAGAVAPFLRGQGERAAKRTVYVTNSDGDIVRVISGAELQDGILKRAGIELAVADGVTPKAVICQFCGKTVSVPKGRARVPSACLYEDGGCYRQKTCAEDGCGAQPRRKSFQPALVKKRHGEPWRCKAHAPSGWALLPRQKRVEGGRRTQARRTKEVRSEIARRGSKKARESGSERIVNCQNCNQAIAIRRPGAPPRVCPGGCVRECAHCRRAISVLSAKRAAMKRVAPVCQSCATRRANSRRRRSQ